MASTTLASLSPAVTAAHGLKGLLCAISDMRIGVGPDTGIFGFAGWATGLVIYYGLVLPIPFVLLGSLGAFQKCLPFLRVFRRFPLAFGTVVASMVLYAAFMYTLFYPVSLIVSDLCSLMDSIKEKGAMKGFPQEKPPIFCGPDGPMGNLITATSGIVTQSYGTMCSSYNTTCGVGVLATPKLGGHGLVATVCPATLAYPATAVNPAGADPVPINTILSPESCAKPTTGGQGFTGTQPSGPGGRESLPFNHWGASLRDGVKYRNVRYGTSAATENEVLSYNHPSKVKATTCKYSWYDSTSVVLTGTPLSANSIKWLNSANSVNLPSSSAVYPRFVDSNQLRKASCAAGLDSCTEFVLARLQLAVGLPQTGDFDAPAHVPYACGRDLSTGRALPCTDKNAVTDPLATANKVFKCHGAKDAPAWLATGTDGDLDLMARMLKVDSDAFPITEDLRVLVEPTAAWDADGYMPGTAGIDMYFSCYDFQSKTSGATCLDGAAWDTSVGGDSPCKDQRLSTLGACAAFDTGTGATPANGPQPDSSASSTHCRDLAMDIFGAAASTSAAWGSNDATQGRTASAPSNDVSRYSLSKGVCKYHATKAQIQNNEAPFACAMDDRQTPVVCKVTDVSVSNCDKSFVNPQTFSGCEGDADTCCDDPRTQRFASAIVRTEELAVMSEEMLFKGYEYTEPSTCTYPDQCEAGVEMRKIVDCSVIDILATELYEPLCESLGGGLVALASAYTTFVFGYAFCAIILISGYKRWQTRYQVPGAPPTLADFKDAATSGAGEGVEKPDFKELTKRPSVYKLEEEFENTIVWGNDETDKGSGAPFSKIILPSQFLSVSGPELLKPAEGVDVRATEDVMTLGETKKKIETMQM